jgi:hypothetical protein
VPAAGAVEVPVEVVIVVTLAVIVLANVVLLVVDVEVLAVIVLIARVAASTHQSTPQARRRPGWYLTGPRLWTC